MMTIPLLGTYLKKRKLKRYLHSYVCCNIIHNGSDMESTLSVHQWMNGFKNVIYIHSRILFSLKKEKNPVIYNNMKDPGAHHISQTKKDKYHMISPICGN